MKKSKSKFQNMKKGYLIVRINIKDAELFQQYPPLSTKAVEKFGGKYLIRGGTFDVVEGIWPAERTTVVEFESFEKAKEFYNSVEYNEAKNVRQKIRRKALLEYRPREVPNFEVQNLGLPGAQRKNWQP